MEYKPKTTNKPPHYAKIPLSKRIKLVQEVLNKSHSISKSAKRLNIKSSTAKLIIKKYKEQGLFFEKRSDRKARLKQMQEQAQLRQPSQHFLTQAVPQASPSCNNTLEATPLEVGNGIINNNYETGIGGPLFGVYSWLGFGNIGSMTPLLYTYFL